MKTNEDRRRIDLANVLLDIVDREKRFVRGSETGDEETGDTEELRMQIREVAFAVLNGREVTPEMLS